MKLEVWCDMIDITRFGDVCRRYAAGRKHAAVRIIIPFWVARILRGMGVKT